MKFASLLLRAYGPFDDALLDFEAAPAGLQIVYGPNEQGKSTALRAVSAFLFGIDARSEDRFERDYSAMRVGAVLVDAGARHALMRRKGNRNTLFRFDEATREEDTGAPVDASLIARMLGAVDAQTFALMHGIGHPQLRAGGRTLLDGSSELGTALFEAASGVQHVRRISARFQAEADELFAPRGRVKRLNLALSEFADAQAAVRVAGVRPREWESQRHELERAEQAFASVERNVAGLRARQARVERLLALVPLVASRLEQATLVSAATGSPDMPPDASQRLAAATQRLQEAGSRIDADAVRLDGVQQRMAALGPSVAHLEAAAAIVQLAGRAADAVELQRAQAELRLSVVHQAERLARALRELSADAPDAADALRAEAAARVPSRGAVAEARALLGARAQLDARIGAAREQLERSRQALVRAREAAAAADPSPDLGALEVAVGAAEARGLLEPQMAQLQARLAATDRELERQARALGAASAQELACMQLPPSNWVDGLQSRLSELERTLAQNDAESRQPRTDLPLREEELGRLVAERALVTRDVLVRAREHRDSLVHEGDAPQVVALLAAIRHADELADARYADAARVARYESLGERIAQLHARLAQLERDASRTIAERQSLEAQWAQALRASGAPALAPVDYRAWALRQEQLVAALRDRDAQAAELAALRAEIDVHVAALGQALAAAGLPAVGPSSLSALLAHCRALLAQAAQRQALHERLASGVARAVTDVDDCTVALSVLGHDVARQRDPWHRALAALGLDGDAGVAQVEARIAELDSLKEVLAAFDDSRRQLEAAGAAVRGFADAVAALAAQLGEPVPEPGHAAAFVARSHARLLASQQAQRAQLGLAGEAEALRSALEGHRAQVALARGVVDTLQRQAAVDDLPALESAIEASDARRGARLAVARLDALIAEASGNQREACDEAARADPDALRAERATLAAAIEAGETDLQQALEARTHARRAFEAIDGGPAAAQAAEDARAKLAAVRRLATDYARLRLARDLLETAIQHHQQRAQGPLLAAAQRWFARMTGNRWTGLRPDWVDDRQVLRVQRADGALLPVEALSEGTADQLYLALRLAAVEVRSRAAGPVPLLLDDVLMTFDDERAGFALAALAELGRDNQVIYFTHHRHLTELALRQLPAGSVAVQALQRDGGAVRAD